MLVYRLATSVFAKDLSGEGARLFGGRWNNKGVPCVYCASSRALAVLEFSVNVDALNMPADLVLVTIEIPDKNIIKLAEADLPINWNIYPAPYETKAFGTDILMAGKYAVIELPSCVIPREFSYCLNPLHKEADKFKILSAEKFPFDSRIKK